MGQTYLLECTNCGYQDSFIEGTTMQMIDNWFTVACDNCYNIETRKYLYPEGRPLLPAPATGWWGRKKRQKQIDVSYEESCRRWTAELEKRRNHALLRPCNQCGSNVHKVYFGSPFIDQIPVDIGCPKCKQFGSMKVCLQGMFD